MSQQFVKGSDLNNDSAEGFYQMLMQQHHAGLRIPPSPHPPLPSSSLQQQHAVHALGLGNFASLGSSFQYSSIFPSAIDISRQHLLQSVLTANEQRLLEQRRRAIQEQLSMQQSNTFMRFDSVPPSTNNINSRPQEPPSSNIQIKAEDPNHKKRGFDELDSSEEADSTRATELPKPIEIASQESQKPPSVEPKKRSPKKFSPRKYSKNDDAFLNNQEPKKDTKWLQMLEELKEYKAKHGNCIVPRGYAPNPRLASWVAEQR